MSFLTSSLFWKIVGMGIAVPSTIIILATGVTVILARGDYRADLPKVSMFYLISIIGWAIFISEVM